jgi:hypothetical protein
MKMARRIARKQAAAGSLLKNPAGIHLVADPVSSPGEIRMSRRIASKQAATDNESQAGAVPRRTNGAKGHLAKGIARKEAGGGSEDWMTRRIARKNIPGRSGIS